MVDKNFLNEPKLLSLHFYDMHLASGCSVRTTYACPDAALACPAGTTSFRYHDSNFHYILLPGG